jgi:hypothetical protein
MNQQYDDENMTGITIIKVLGRLDTKWKDCFEGMEIHYEGNKTILTDNLKDEAHLHGILNLIRDLNLKLISINPVDNEKKVTQLKRRQI